MSIERLERQLVHTGSRLQLFQDRVRLENGLERRWEVLEQPEVVVVLPFEVTAEGMRLLLVRQYRYAIGQDLLEFPAGTVEAGEAPEATARRELAEETGYAASRWIALPPVFRMPGTSNERTYFFVATQLTAASGYSADPEEAIALVWLAAAEFEERIRSGAIEDGKSLILWLLAQPHLPLIPR
ncbi:NUDIX domain-containing protein [Gloeobacter kilaueensis]|uniref:NUDIX hydrolase n=1 Tax=Gloeobacter kilaueensis (strain ATCC BAA-2537 / CCAP 1431/1 / ULC 316 / JS1) TaxID=1183438 RepID=U5QR16_GLOK1|nr:NUDIX hydrolase [Gloeobacter kilaueensis]AGY60099.1 NUDIX hydrolase [Gloeobacter kilaueensis JS1]